MQKIVKIIFENSYKQIDFLCCLFWFLFLFLPHFIENKTNEEEKNTTITENVPKKIGLEKYFWGKQKKNIRRQKESHYRLFTTSI